MEMTKELTALAIVNARLVIRACEAELQCIALTRAVLELKGPIIHKEMMAAISRLKELEPPNGSPGN